MSITIITPQKLSELIHSGAEVELIDVRTPVAVAQSRCTSSVGQAVVANRRARNSSPPVTRML